MPRLVFRLPQLIFWPRLLIFWPPQLTFVLPRLTFPPPQLTFLLVQLFFRSPRIKILTAATKIRYFQFVRDLKSYPDWIFGLGINISATDKFKKIVADLDPGGATKLGAKRAHSGSLKNNWDKKTELQLIDNKKN